MKNIILNWSLIAVAAICLLTAGILVFKGVKVKVRRGHKAAARKKRALITFAVLFLAGAITSATFGGIGLYGLKNAGQVADGSKKAAGKGAEKADDADGLEEPPEPMKAVDMDDAELLVWAQNHGIDLSDDSFCRGSMPSMAQPKIWTTSISRTGKINPKKGISDAVTHPIWADQKWYDEHQGVSIKAGKNAMDKADFNLGQYSKKMEAALIQRTVKWKKQWEELLSGKNKLEQDSIYRGPIYNEMVHNPVYFDMWVQVFADDPLATENNKWLIKLKKQLDDVYASKEGLSKLLIIDPSGNMANYKVRRDVQIQAIKICVLLDYFVGYGVDNPESNENYHLPMQSEASHMRTSLCKEQENKPAYIMIYQSKRGTAWSKKGVNLEDLRAIKYRLNTPIKPKPIPKVKKAPKVTPKPEVTPKPTPKVTPAPRVTPDNTPKPTSTPKVTPTPKPTATPKVTDSPSPSPSATPKVTDSPSPTPSATPVVTETPRPTDTPKPTLKPTPSPDGNGGKDPAELPSDKDKNNAPVGGGDDKPEDKDGKPKPKDDALPGPNNNVPTDRKEEDEKKDDEEEEEKKKQEQEAITGGGKDPNPGQVSGSDSPGTGNITDDKKPDETVSDDGEKSTTDSGGLITDDLGDEGF